MLIKKVQLDATVCRHLFTAESLYMFRASQRPSSGALKTVTATSGIGHNTGTATSFHPSSGALKTVTAASGIGHNTGTSYLLPTWSDQIILIRPRWKEVAVPVL